MKLIDVEKLKKTINELQEVLKGVEVKTKDTSQEKQKNEWILCSQSLPSDYPKYNRGAKFLVVCYYPKTNLEDEGFNVTVEVANYGDGLDEYQWEFDTDPCLIENARQNYYKTIDDEVYFLAWMPIPDPPLSEFGWELEYLM